MCDNGSFIYYLDWLNDGIESGKIIIVDQQMTHVISFCYDTIYIYIIINITTLYRPLYIDIYFCKTKYYRGKISIPYTTYSYTFPTLTDFFCHFHIKDKEKLIVMTFKTESIGIAITIYYIMIIMVTQWIALDRQVEIKTSACVQYGREVRIVLFFICKSFCYVLVYHFVVCNVLLNRYYYIYI